MKYPKPYFRSQRDSWCVQIGTRQVTLAKGKANKAEAMREYHRVMAEAGVEVPRPKRAEVPVFEAVDRFLEAAQRRVKPNTFEQYRIKLADLTAGVGRLPLARLTLKHLEDWLAAHEWSNSTRRGAVAAVKVWLNWCVREDLIDGSPAAGLRRPKMARRERILAVEERAAIRARCNDSFGELLDALTWTGARPGAVWSLEAKHVDWSEGIARLPGKTSDATGELLTVHLVPKMLELCRRLAERYPTGPLFRNSDGEPWNRNSVRCRFRRLRARLKAEGVDISGVGAYTFRHTFATDALERGLGIADVAALMGHTDIRTTTNYAHLHQRRSHLRKQAMKAVEPEGEN